MSEPRDLSRLVHWFRAEWEAEMGSGRIHVRESDEGGYVAFQARFQYLIELPEVSEELTGKEMGERRVKSFPLRYHLRNMARASHRGRTRAEFLFRLACHDFDTLSAARATSPAAYDHHGELWALDFAEESLWRLRRRCLDPRWNDLKNQPRTFVQRRIGKSEAQAAAETAGKESAA